MWSTAVFCSQVEGLAGTYIANTRDPSRAFGSTLISYDKGGNWVKLTPPLLDKGGSGVVCQPVRICNIT